jgi:hypothetical protein
MRRSTDFLLRAATAWIFTYIWQADWTNVPIENIPKACLYIILGVNLAGYYYMFRGIFAWAKGE